MPNEQWDAGDIALASAKTERVATINTAIEHHVGKEGLAHLESHIKAIGDAFKEYIAVQENREAAEHAIDAFRNLVNNLFARLYSVNKRSPELIGESLTLANATLQPEVSLLSGHADKGGAIYAGGFSRAELTQALQYLKLRYSTEFREVAEK